MPIILRLDRVMADRKMSLNELSEKVGVANVNLSKLKNGRVSAIRFSTLEAIQSAANPGINSTIKDKYFNSASSTPAVVFPGLINLAQKHLKKINNSKTLNRQLGEILDKIGEEFPARLNLPQQGSFQLGYYHQTTAWSERKEKEEE